MDEQRTRGKLSILTCESGRPFAVKVARYLTERAREVPLIESREIRFANSERKTVIEESIRGSDLYIIQDVENAVDGCSVYDNVSILKTAIDAAWRSEPSHITVIVPSYPFSRQDKQHGREGIAAALFASEMENLNVDQVITLDVHNEAIAGFFRRAKFENLRASKSIISFITKNLDVKNLVIMSPDAGGASRAEYYASQLKKDLVIGYKRRDYALPNTVDSIEVLGEVNGKDVIIIDDIIDTAGSIIKVIEKVKALGAQNSYAACSLPLFNGEALQRMTRAYERGSLTAVIGTDAVFHGQGFQKSHPWYWEVTVADLFAEVILSLNEHRSIAGLLQ